MQQSKVSHNVQLSGTQMCTDIQLMGEGGIRIRGAKFV